MNKPLIVAVLFVSQSIYAKYDSESVRAKIKENRSEFESCYSKALVDDPQLSGKLTLKFEVNDLGQVQKSEINEKKSTLKNQKLNACVIEKIQSMTFPPTPQKQIARISYPFKFVNPK